MSDVEYGVLEVREAMPERPSERTSSILALVEQIVADPNAHGKATCIAAYKQKTAATAAANSLRSRFGKTASVRGLSFSAAKVKVAGEAGDMQERHGLWVFYDPSKIVDGEWEAYNQAATEKRREANKKAAVKAKERKAAEKAEKKAAESESPIERAVKGSKK